MPTIQLYSIRFNHDTASARTDAINIRRNGGIPVVLPEWRYGETWRDEDSPAVCAASSQTSWTHLYATGRLGGCVSACSRNMLGANRLEKLQPEAVL